MDQANKRKQKQAETIPLTWADLVPGEPDDPPGVAQPLRRPNNITDDEWLEDQQANALSWLVWVEDGMRALVLVNELALWRSCAAPACRRHKRCADEMADGASVPQCCASGSRLARLRAALDARDEATRAFVGGEAKGAPDT